MQRTINMLISNIFVPTEIFEHLVSHTESAQYLSNSMEQSRSWEANRSSASQDIPRIL
jgi:hypothetical protein